MADFSPYGNLFISISEEWKKAEADVKQAEQVCNEIVISSILELRYAGRRLIQALELIQSEVKHKEVESLLQDACFDCHRARHDAIDAATSQIAIVINLSIQKLKLDVILTAFPEFPQLVRDLQNVRAKIVKSRSASDDRDAIYETIESLDFPKLASQFSDFQACEEMMKAMAGRRRFERALSYVGIVIGVVGCLIAGFALYYSLR